MSQQSNVCRVDTPIWDSLHFVDAHLTHFVSFLDMNARMYIRVRMCVSCIYYINVMDSFMWSTSTEDKAAAAAVVVVGGGVVVVVVVVVGMGWDEMR